LGLIPIEIDSPSASVIVTIFNEETHLESLSLAWELREAGIKVNCYPQADKLGKQLKHGDRIGIKIAVLIGPEEIAAQQVTLKNLTTGDQKTISRSQTVLAINEILGGPNSQRKVNSRF
jgi:histidyl-tRNA synthetase